MMGIPRAGVSSGISMKNWWIEEWPLSAPVGRKLPFVQAWPTAAGRPITVARAYHPPVPRLAVSRPQIAGDRRVSSLAVEHSSGRDETIDPVIASYLFEAVAFSVAKLLPWRAKMVSAERDLGRRERA